MYSCPGVCRPIALSDGSGVGTKCDECHNIQMGVPQGVLGKREIRGMHNAGTYL